MPEVFSISHSFAKQYLRFSKPEYLQFYFYLKYVVSETGKFPSTRELADAMDCSPEHAAFILDYWVSRGELIPENDGYRFPDRENDTAPAPSGKAHKRSMRPSYTMAEIDAVSAGNPGIPGLFYQAESILHKMLTPSDMELLYSFVDWLGLPPEVITMLLSYASKQGKTGRRYLETVAIDWADRGIDSFEAAEAHIANLEQADSMERKIRSILGIYDRALTTTEKKYISGWSASANYTPELITLAYDRTVAHTGKLSFAYMGKILDSWIANGLLTPEAVQEFDKKPEKPVKSGSAAKSKFNNYQDSNKTDYAKLEEDLLDMILDRGE